MEEREKAISSRQEGSSREEAFKALDPAEKGSPGQGSLRELGGEAGWW